MGLQNGTSPTISASQKVFTATRLEPAVKLLADRGLDSRAALQAIGLEQAEVHSPTARVSAEQLVRFYAMLRETVGDPRLGFEIGLGFRLTTFGMYGLAMLTSRDHRRAIHFAARYHIYALPLYRLSFAEADGTAVWTIDPLAHPLVDAGLHEFLVEAGLGALTSLHQDLMGEEFRPTAFGLAVPAPSIAHFPTDLSWPVLYGQSANSFAFDAAWLDRRPRLESRGTHTLLMQLFEEQLGEMKGRDSVAAKVRAVLVDALGEIVRFGEVARRLNMSERSLRRQLEADGTSFRELLDEFNGEMAIRHLRETSMTNDEIAHILGYSDAANFRRAFRRWSGASPGQYRGTSSAIGPR